MRPTGARRQTSFFVLFCFLTLPAAPHASRTRARVPLRKRLFHRELVLGGVQAESFFRISLSSD
eukprot:14478910-Heterocapsa_arctica.AAC.1